MPANNLNNSLLSLIIVPTAQQMSTFQSESILMNKFFKQTTGIDSNNSSNDIHADNGFKQQQQNHFGYTLGQNRNTIITSGNNESDDIETQQPRLLERTVPIEELLHNQTNDSSKGNERSLPSPVASSFQHQIDDCQQKQTTNNNNNQEQIFCDRQLHSFPMIIYQQQQNQQSPELIAGSTGLVNKFATSNVAEHEEAEQCQLIGESNTAKSASEVDEGFCYAANNDNNAVDRQFDIMPKLEPELSNEYDMSQRMFVREQLKSMDVINSLQLDRQPLSTTTIEDFRSTDVLMDNDGDENGMQSMPNLDIETGGEMPQCYQTQQQQQCCLTVKTPTKASSGDAAVTSKLAAPSISPLLPPLPTMLMLHQPQKTNVNNNDNNSDLSLEIRNCDESTTNTNDNNNSDNGNNSNISFNNFCQSDLPSTLSASSRSSGFSSAGSLDFDETPSPTSSASSATIPMEIEGMKVANQNEEVEEHQGHVLKQEHKKCQKKRQTRRKQPMMKTGHVINRNKSLRRKMKEQKVDEMRRKRKANAVDGILVSKTVEETENRPPSGKKQQKAAKMVNKVIRSRSDNKKHSKSLNNGSTTACNNSHYPTCPSSSATVKISRSSAQPSSLRRLNSNWRPIGKGIYCRLPKADAVDEPRLCFDAIRHRKAVDVRIRLGDCVLVNSDEAEDDIFVGRVICIYYDPNKRAILLSLLWFYTIAQLPSRPPNVHLLDQHELFASQHLDCINADSVQDLVYVLSYSEYCRYHAQIAVVRMPSERRPPQWVKHWVPNEKDYPRKQFLPQINTAKDMVFFCRGIYSIRTRRINTMALPKKFFLGIG